MPVLSAEQCRAASLPGTSPLADSRNEFMPDLTANQGRLACLDV
jgi:hypothetical protein